MNGHPWHGTTYARMSGYVEQSDIHSAKVIWKLYTSGSHSCMRDHRIPVSAVFSALRQAEHGMPLVPAQLIPTLWNPMP